MHAEFLPEIMKDIFLVQHTIHWGGGGGLNCWKYLAKIGGLNCWK